MVPTFNELILLTSIDQEVMIPLFPSKYLGWMFGHRLRTSEDVI
jgi:hypothetical protein